MRTRIAIVLAGCVAGSLLSLATPASAYCEFDIHEVTGHGCDNICTAAGWAAYKATGQHLPGDCPF